MHLRGAEKIRDKHLTYENLREELEKLPPETNINVLFRKTFWKYGSFSGTPSEVLNFIDGIISPLETATLYFYSKCS